jgi:hypothetical protein
MRNLRLSDCGGSTPPSPINKIYKVRQKAHQIITGSEIMAKKKMMMKDAEIKKKKSCSM